MEVLLPAVTAAGTRNSPTCARAGTIRQRVAIRQRIGVRLCLRSAKAVLVNDHMIVVYSVRDRARNFDCEWFGTLRV